MNKFFIVSAFLFVTLLTSVFAQSTNWEDYGLNEEAVKYLSEKEKQDILNSRTPAQTQEYIKQQIQDVKAGATQTEPSFPLSVIDNDQNQVDTSSNTEIVSCFDYYTFGSIEADFTSKSSNAVSGMTINFSGTIKNNNSYPVVQGTLYVKIFKNIGGEKNPNGPDVVDQFIALDNINLPANSSIPAEFSWKVPSYAMTGDYRLVTYFTSDKKFNLSGLSFTDDIVGNSFDFKVFGEETTLMFDKSSVVINQTPYYFAAYPPRISQTDTANISLSIDNTTNTTQSAQVVWKLYAWDAMNPENFVREFKTSANIQANSQEQISFSIPEKEAPVYLLIGELQYKDTKSIVGIRYVRDGVDKVRLNYPAITSYPLVEGQQTTLFTCLHNAGQSSQVQNNKVILEVLDQKGKVIESYTYEGIVTGDMMAVKKDFTPKTSLNTFSVHASLYTDGKLVDESTMQYSCKDLDPTKCTEEKTLPIIQIFIGIISSVLLLIILILIKRKTKGIELMIVLFALTTGIFVFDVGVKDTVAQTQMPIPGGGYQNPNITGTSRQVTWNTTLSTTLQYFWNNGGTSSASGWVNGLANPNISVKYNTKIINLSTNQEIANNSTVNIGTNIRLQFIPHHSYDIYWFGTGYSSDSPYGDWKANAVGPTGSSGEITCEYKDFVNLFINRVPPAVYPTTGLTGYYQIYIPLVLAPPTKTIVPGSNLSCGSRLGNEITGYYYDCTVNSSGAINFNFASTIGKFYYRYATIWQGPGLQSDDFLAKKYRENPNPVCIGNNIAMKNSASPYVLNVPAQTVAFTLNAIAAPPVNQPPNPPTITGPTSGVLNDTKTFSGTFNFVATDPDGNTIHYEIDWDQNGTTDQFLPSSGQVTSGTSQSTTKSWSSLPQTFRAKTVDQYAATSTWSTYTICSTGQSLINGKCASDLSLSCQNQTNITIPFGVISAGPGSVSVEASGGIPPYTYSGGNSGSGSTYSINSISSNGQYQRSVPSTFNVTDSNSSTNSKSCSFSVTDENYAPSPPSSSNFYFLPNIAGSDNLCPLYVTATNASSCELRNRIGDKVLPDLTMINGSIDNIDGSLKASVGTYTLWCKKSEISAFIQLGTSISCISNPEFREN